MCTLFLVSLLVSVIVLALTYMVNIFKRPSNYPPGPPWTPILGNGPELKKLSKALGGQHLAFAKLSEQYETDVLGLKLGGELVIVVTSYWTARAVQLSEDYEGRPKNFFMKLRSAGTEKGITGTDGELWRIQRNFVKIHLRKLGFGKKSMEQKIQDEASEILTLLQENEGKSIQTSPILAISVLNIIWALISGSRLRRDDPQLARLLYLFDLRSEAFDMAGGLLNQFPWLRLIAPEKSGYRLIVRMNDELRALMSTAIKRHHETWTEGREDDLIYSFISEMRKADGKETTFTDDQLIMVCLDLFLAGSQTTSNTIDFALLMMILHPDIQNKVHSSLSDEFGKNEEINFSDRNRVPYVEAVIFEVERLYQVVPISGPRRVLRDTKLKGYSIPKDTTVLISLYSSHSSEEFWKDPEVFRPERFLDENGRLSIPDRLMTFGLGKRRCLGEILAKTSIFSFFCTIMRNYRISSPSDCEKPTGRPIPGITFKAEKYKAVFTKL
ncbi:unnamed protein product [Phaedon cochleariae]|uniref:Cytochrome P450 n=1 Tax=Phaedon cochleariae TaxID=80249 RepID=A0A9P0DF19_PHACE|nr:unnamed protein product [Phaedon cochleariae]